MNHFWSMNFFGVHYLLENLYPPSARYVNLHLLLMYPTFLNQNFGFCNPEILVSRRWVTVHAVSNLNKLLPMFWIRAWQGKLNNEHRAVNTLFKTCVLQCSVAVMLIGSDYLSSWGDKSNVRFQEWFISCCIWWEIYFLTGAWLCVILALNCLFFWYFQRLTLL